MNCRLCKAPLIHTLIDLGSCPPSNAYLSKSDLNKPEQTFPLRVKVCDKCWLVQTEEYTQAEELFTDDYAYFSSASKSWLAHAKEYTNKIIDLLRLDNRNLVIEVASNDGYLLKNFVAENIPCLGIEPTKGTADVAESLGIPIIRQFFGLSLAEQLVAESKQADLIIGNNVYAHVPDISDFTAGLKAALKAGGTITLEFPHLLNLIEFNQFDTIYHEHYSYLSLTVVTKIFSSHGLRVFDVTQIPTHGGSLRLFGCHQTDGRKTSKLVAELIAKENKFGLNKIETYLKFQQQADVVKNALLEFLLSKKVSGESVVAYGAAAKGNTILNYAGVKPDLLPYVCDAARSKQHKFLPGSHIPILPPNAILQTKPDYVLILPWNIAKEIKHHLISIKNWGGKFVTAVPKMLIEE